VPPAYLIAAGKPTEFFETRNTVHLKIYTVLRYEVLTAVAENECHLRYEPVAW